MFNDRIRRNGKVPEGKVRGAQQWPGDLQRLRNIGIQAHIDAGEDHDHRAHPVLRQGAAKPGEVNNASGYSSWMEQEQERGITITSAATTCECTEGPSHQHH